MLVSTGHRPDVPSHTLGFPGLGVEPLSGPPRLSLKVRFRYRVRPGDDAPNSWGVVVTGYEYELLDEDARWVLAYHWHPTGRSTMTAPHLHVRQILPLDLRSVHLPTGVVSLPSFLRLAILELGIRPLRADWSDVLEAAEQAHQAHVVES